MRRDGSGRKSPTRRDLRTDPRPQPFTPSESAQSARDGSRARRSERPGDRLPASSRIRARAQGRGTRAVGETHDPVRRGHFEDPDARPCALAPPSGSAPTSATAEEPPQSSARPSPLRHGGIGRHGRTDMRQGRAVHSGGWRAARSASYPIPFERSVRRPSAPPLLPRVATTPQCSRHGLPTLHARPSLGGARQKLLDVVLPTRIGCVGAAPFALEGPHLHPRAHDAAVGAITSSARRASRGS